MLNRVLEERVALDHELLRLAEIREDCRELRPQPGEGHSGSCFLFFFVEVQGASSVQGSRSSAEV